MKSNYYPSIEHNSIKLNRQIINNRKEHSLTTSPSKSKISINNINVNANNLNLNTNAVLISNKKDNTDINLSLYQKTYGRKNASTEHSPSPFSKVLATQHKIRLDNPFINKFNTKTSKAICNNNNNECTQKMINNLRDQFNEIANKTTVNNQARNISIIESYSNTKGNSINSSNSNSHTNSIHQNYNNISNSDKNTISNSNNNNNNLFLYNKNDYMKSYLNSSKASKDSSLNASFNLNHAYHYQHKKKTKKHSQHKIHNNTAALNSIINPTPTEYNYCETENLTLNSIDELEPSDINFTTSPSIINNMIQDTDLKAQSLKAIDRSKGKIKKKTNNNTINDDLKKKYDYLHKKNNDLQIKMTKVIEENSDMKACIEILKKSYLVQQRTYEDIIEKISIDKEENSYKKLAYKQKEEINFLIDQNNQLKQLILSMYDNILIYTNDTIKSDKNTIEMISRVLTENKMLREIASIPKKILPNDKEDRQRNDKQDKYDSSFDSFFSKHHNRSETTIKLNTNANDDSDLAISMSLSSSSVLSHINLENNRQSLYSRYNTMSNNNCNYNNASSQHHHNNNMTNYTGHFGNSHLYVKNNMRREMMDGHNSGMQINNNSNSKAIKESLSKLKISYVKKKKNL